MFAFLNAAEHCCLMEVVCVKFSIITLFREQSSFKGAELITELNRHYHILTYSLAKKSLVEILERELVFVGVVSLISLAVLSYERYSTLTLCHKRSDDFRKALLAVAGSWIYSLVWTVPPLLGWSSYGVEGAGTSCSVRWSSESAESTSYIICLFVFCLVVPVMVMVYCYGRLLYAVKQVGKIHKNAARKREYHVLFMVITTVICYLVCWIPYGVIALLATFGKPGAVTPITSIIPSILAKSSTVCNPIIYILMNKQEEKDARLSWSVTGLITCQADIKIHGQN
ncbi:Pinopsin [Lonchura striata]|uniref:Pinopsin n=1 Tax=Lonchura striata TaxID=40157 RepID=A0A218V632_9PASE|nr:Pinopsin [Lonchura striata domestica]